MEQPIGNLEDDRLIFCWCYRDDEALRTWLLLEANLPRVKPEGADFMNFQLRPGVHEAFGAARAFADGEGSPILMLVGEPGTGKTHLLEAIGRKTIQRGRSVRYEQVADLLASIRRAIGNPDGPDPLRLAETAQLLLLDDLGLQKDSDWTLETLTTLIDGRYRQGRRMVVATNKSQSELAAHGNYRLASRLFDTHSGIVTVIAMDATDYRTTNTKG